MNEKQPEPTKIMLEELQTKYPLLDFWWKRSTEDFTRNGSVYSGWRYCRIDL